MDRSPMRTVHIPYGSQELAFRLHAAWLGEIVSPPILAPHPDPGALVRLALDHPVGSPRLEQIAQSGKTVAVLVDDATRKTPVKLILPEVLNRLESAGIKERDISIVIALGTHRPMTPDEISARLGAEIAARFRIVNTPASDQEQMVYLGSTHAIPAWVHRAAAEADLRIGLGMITPHMDAGFSGGAKIILPGIGSETTVDAFHLRSVDLPGNPLGDINAPLRQELEQFVVECISLDFIVNAVTTINHDMVQCVAGHFIAAHRLGATYARKAFGAAVKRRYPLVVASCYPYDRDLWQSMKGLWCGELLTEDGGTLILVTEAAEGSLEYPNLPVYIGADPAELRQAIQAGKSGDLKEAATGVMVGRIKQRIRLALVSTGLTPDDAGRMGIERYDSVESALAAGMQKLPDPARPGSIAVLSHAGLVLPLVPGGV